MTLWQVCLVFSCRLKLTWVQCRQCLKSKRKIYVYAGNVLQWTCTVLSVVVPKAVLLYLHWREPGFLMHHIPCAVGVGCFCRVMPGWFLSVWHVWTRRTFLSFLCRRSGMCWGVNVHLSGMCGDIGNIFFLSFVSAADVWANVNSVWHVWTLLWTFLSVVCEYSKCAWMDVLGVRGGIAASYGHIRGTSVAPLLRRCRPLLPFAPLKWTHCHKSRGRTVQPSLRFTKSVLSWAALYSKAFSSFHRARIVERLITTAKWAALVLTLGLVAATDVMQAISIPATVCWFVTLYRRLAHGFRFEECWPKFLKPWILCHTFFASKRITVRMKFGEKLRYLNSMLKWISKP